MPAEQAATVPAAPALRKRNRKRARVRIDRRYALGRRVTELERVLREKIGAEAASDPLVAAAVRHAAESTAIAEDMRGRLLRGEPGVSADHVTRATRSAHLLTQKVLERKPREVEENAFDLLAGGAS